VLGRGFGTPTVSARSPHDKLPRRGRSGVSAEGAAEKQAAGSGGSADGSPGLSGARPRRDQGEPGDADVAVICGLSDDGQGLEIIRKRGERLESGTIRRLEQGKPIHGEVVRLRPREHQPLVCDVEIQVPSQTPAASSSTGPAQVATETYRKNWDAIYGRNNKKSRALLN
jgi:hypothetical protein